MRVSEIVARGYDVDTVKRVERLLYLAEYKRRQSAPGRQGDRARISAATGAIPIINRFRDPGSPARSPDASLVRGASQSSTDVVDF